MSTWILARLHHHDERMLHAFVSRRHPGLDRLMRALTHLGDALVTIAITLVLLAAVPDAGVLAAFTLVGSHLCVQLIKRTVTRARPCLPMGVSALVQPPDRFSFPSGHAAASLSVALAVAQVLPGPAAFGILALAMLVGLSRCYLGVHYPGDVVAGWTLAALWFAGAGIVPV
ncbi:MAG TPA: phosphatase PAP2 family protein [Longimicrobium sp.]|nr:phosphatase PAP2 family protein [Longimicrobium sp.]